MKRAKPTLLAICAALGVGCPGDDGSEGSTTAADATTMGSPATESGGASTDAGAMTTAVDGTGTGTDGSSTGPAADEGDFTVLTYNVAGLPEPLSSSMPATYIPLISPKLNAFDLVLVQEDFAYHDQLIADVEHPYLSEPGGGGTYGDGLNRMSQSAFADHTRAAWEVCFGEFDNGSDCLTDKGFAWARHEVAPGVTIDVYNLHHDAGGSPGDVDARNQQVAQLVAAIAANSADRAIIVAGDTNMDEEDEPTLQMLLAGADLRDACRELSCGQDGRIDRVMIRDGADVALTVANWRVDTSFVTDTGEDLSDHEAIAVDVHWARL